MTMRVLVFDDEAAVGRLVVRIATMAGMDAVAVTDADAFAQHLLVNPPQLIVLDMRLGNTDGIEQLRLLAEQRYTGSLVLMSGFDARVLGTARALGESFGLKFVTVLEKPLKVEALEEVFERLQSANQSLSAARVLEAIVNDELSLDFQPIVTRKPHTLVKLEALVRWDHPTAGRMLPGEFLSVAENDAITIDALTNWVVHAVVDAYEVLVELGLNVPLAVNLSTQNLHDLTLPNRLEEHLRAAGMPAHHLCLEISESAAFRDTALTMDILSRVRLKGMQLAIDDFGIGFSSLKLLRQMPFSEIKIDQSFVGDLTTSRDSRAIVKSIIDLAANMDMACVAEGVETEEIAELLEQLGACGMQGYHIARPMPVEAVPAWLAIWIGSPSRAPELLVPESAPAPADAHVPRETSGAMSNPATQMGKVAVRLSPRQHDVMLLLSEGCSVKEIARRLDLGVGTVKVHISLAYSALGARNRIEAVMRFVPRLERPPNGHQRVSTPC